MARLLVALILLIQGIPVQQGGTVTGVLRDSQGMPIAGVRIAAVARPDSLEQAGEGTAMAGIAETDERGRFTLENVPPGRYYIAAGRLDLQTFHPGTQNMAEATVITVSAGAVVSDINFILNGTSLGRSPTGDIGGIPSAALPVRVNVENGGKLPVSSGGQFTYIKLSPNAGSSLTVPIDGNVLTVSAALAGDFRIEVENLPETYVVKSILYGSTDVTRGTFRLTAANFPSRYATTPIALPVPANTAQPGPLPTNPQDLAAYIQALANSPPSLAAAAATVQSRALYTLRSAGGFAPVPNPAYTPPSPITITIGTTMRPPVPGVRVTGRSGSTSKRLIYISGRPGTLYADGSFEFRGVSPGRHVIATVSNPSAPLAAVVVVGEKDIDGVTLSETPLLPEDIRTPRDPLPAGDYQPGSIVPLTRVTGIVLEESTREPIKEGNVVLTVGNFSRTFPIDETGHFETFSLLPGTYDIRLQIFGHSTNSPTITVEDKDLNLELTSRRLY